MAFGRRTWIALAPMAALVLAPGMVRAGPTCDVNPPTSTQACIDAIQQTGGLVNDIFKDSMGRTALQLPLFGSLYNIYPGCDAASCAGCDPGTDTMPYDCLGEYSCQAGMRDTNGFARFTDVAAAVAKLDHVWANPCRLAQHGLVNGCPQYGTCVADGSPGNYYPWEGLVFDLRANANQVVIFAVNDHTPQPCESLEYTVFLTNNPQSQDIVQDPNSAGADPTKWNRAKLSKVFTQGWYTTRTPDPAGHGVMCGDTTAYSVELDSFVQVFKLPSGADLRYASVVAGNDGKDFPQCAYDSSEAELDAVAGLTDNGAGVDVASDAGTDGGDGGGFVQPDSGTTTTDGGSEGGSDDATAPGGDGGGGDAGTGGSAVGKSSGCGCSTPGEDFGGLPAGIAGLIGAGLLVRRRRSRPSNTVS
jgi:MYXO-CTERM domain-containing protein